MRKVCIAVIGGSKCNAKEARLAEDVGTLIAKRGAVLINGGLGGIMKAVSRGAKRAGGLVVGVLPTANASEANPYVDIAIPTNLGYARNFIVVGADAVIAIGGSIGTLSEIAFAFQRGKVVIGLCTWRLDKNRLGRHRILRAKTPKDAVEIAFSKIKKRI